MITMNFNYLWKRQFRSFSLEMNVNGRVMNWCLFSAVWKDFGKTVKRYALNGSRWFLRNGIRILLFTCKERDRTKGSGARATGLPVYRVAVECQTASMDMCVRPFVNLLVTMALTFLFFTSWQWSVLLLLLWWWYGRVLLMMMTQLCCRHFYYWAYLFVSLQCWISSISYSLIG